VLLVLASILLIVVQVPQHHTVSPIDEYVYIDAVDKVPQELAVRRGQEVNDYARHYLACHGVRAIGFYPEAMCRDNKLADSLYPNGGYTTADIYTPLYFATTWLLSQPLLWAGVPNLVDAGRLTGALWLALAAVLLFAALRRLSVNRWISIGAALAVIGSIPAYSSNTYISTDATALFAGSLMVFLLARRPNPTLRSGLPIAIAAIVVTLLKVQNYAAVVVVVVFLVFRATVDLLASRRRGENIPRQLFLGTLPLAAVTAVLPLLAQAGWLVIRNVIAAGPSPDQGVAAPLGKSALVSEVFKFLPGAIEGGLPPESLGPIGVFIAGTGKLLVVGGVIGALVAARRGSQTESFAGATLFASLAMGPVLAIVTAVTAGYYFVLPSRYGISLIPAYLVCLVLLVRNKRGAIWVAPLCGVVLFIATLALHEG